MSQPSVTVRLGGGTPSQHMTGRGPGGPGEEPLGPPEPGRQGHQGHAKPRDYIDNFMKRPLRSSMVNSTQSRDLVLKLLLATYLSRAPYFFDIGLNRLKTP
jgi:hypothetical protein